MSAPLSAQPPRGRPRRGSLAARQAALLSAAAELFLARGYGDTSMEAVVQAAGISKRTLYQRYPDKAALFAAVLEHIIAQLRPPEDVPLIQGADLAGVLERLAGFMLKAALQPSALALHRLIEAESGRFPEIGQLLARHPAVQQATGLVAALLAEPRWRTPADAPPLPPAQREFLATQFLTLVVTHPRRAALGLAPPLSPAQLRDWPGQCVRLFLHGIDPGS